MTNENYYRKNKWQIGLTNKDKYEEKKRIQFFESTRIKYMCVLIFSVNTEHLSSAYLSM